MVDINRKAEQPYTQEEIDETRPFWLWFATLQFCAKHECEESEEFPCSQTNKCITEYCPPCAAKVFLAKMP
jgi:hypothetical protein